jgi:glucokinase
MPPASGDCIAWAMVEKAAICLGAGLAVAVNLLNPALIVIGGGVARAGALFLKPAEAAMRQRLPPPLREAVRVRPAGLCEAAGIVGAALLAWERWGRAAAPNGRRIRARRSPGFGVESE